MNLRAAGILVVIMSLVGLGMNYRDWGNPDLESPYDAGDFQKLQMILGLFGAGGLGLIIFDWFRRR
ncbi:MAG: hypothetical protein AAGG69_09640 [Pseudomonadota bacterium]